MTLVNAETGELVEPLSAGDAERLSTRIRLRLDTIADNYAAVMPLIREAITRDAHTALGYRSAGEYVSDRFGDALSKLGVEVRREVVRELTEAGLSKRAIAPVVGVSHQQITKDRAATGGNSVATSQTPEPTTPQGEPVSRDVDSGSTPEDGATNAGDAADGGITAPDAPRPPVTGIDGKRYPATRPTHEKSAPVNTKIYPSRKTDAAMSSAIDNLLGVTAGMSSVSAESLAAVDEETRSMWERDLREVRDRLRAVHTLIRKVSK